ncbi:helix-turn-helix domain-containing protein [Actinoplanes sp. NPDC049548]|uniref:helix-turn-helix transcriptional regulator n=1 Tax=Actinoplanes sp. NPDC049548 TaxID=3155152 RepID=UPI00342124EF
MTESFAADVARIAALGEPVRRDLYRYVVAQDEPVSREAAAAATGVAHHVAKFNLDRLVTEGLLEVEYARPAGRGGPGAGRPAKLYRRAGRDISVSLPERRYDLAGQVLAEAVTVATRDGVPVEEALRVAARTTGRALGEQDAAEDFLSVLTRTGYEPRAADGVIVLANCPFHRLAEQYTQLVCGMNLDLVDGLLTAAGPAGGCARLDPGPDRCCVIISIASHVDVTPEM